MFSQEMPASVYKEGSRVQVAQLKDDDDDSTTSVAWSPAVVAKRIWKNNYLVHYSHFPSTKTDQPVQEIVDIQHLRLCPSHTTVDHPSLVSPFSFLFFSLQLISCNSPT